MFAMKFVRPLLLLGALVPFSAGAEDPAIAKVNGIPIPHSRLDIVARNQIAQSQGQQQDTPQYREELRDILITREVLFQEALRRKLDKDPKYIAQLDVMKQQILLSILFEDFLKKHTPSEEATRKEYD
ncbi:MAG: peptidylprolyl isomerase, partial [Burkholderiales bacterium]